MTAELENSPLARLAAALNPAAPQTDRIISANDAMITDVLEVARQHRVAGFLARSFEQSGRLATLSEAVRNQLRQALIDAQFARVTVDQTVRAAREGLEHEKVPFLLLKGAALGWSVYPDPVLRQMTDVDLLVAPADLERALRGLFRRGFRVPDDETLAFWREAYYNVPIESPADGAPLEVHWSIAQEQRHQPDIPGLFVRSQEVVVDGVAYRLLGPADLLLHQALHLSYHYYEPKLAWLIDLVLLMRNNPPVDEVLHRARRWGMALPLALVILQIEKTFPGAADPGLVHFAQDSGRARTIAALFRSKKPVELIRGWDNRRRQLILALLTLDHLYRGFAPVWSWVRRTQRFGDRAGHRKPSSGKQP